MEDGLLVSRAIGGDLDSFGQLYDRYFNRVYDFCWRILRDADEAAEATQDVFMKAMNGLPGLTRASSFKSWLFTIAHNTAVTRAERGARTMPLPTPTHEEAFGSFDVPDPSRLDDPEIVAEDHELSGLVWEAASALSPRDYAVLDLHVRQGLESAEIAQVLNVNKGNAYTMVSRMKQAAGDVIASYIVARRGSKDCEGLRRVLAEVQFPPYSDDARRAVDAHVKDCEVCQRARKALIAPLQIFGSFAAVPAPFALKGDIWRDVSAQWPHGDGAFATSSAGDARSPNDTFEAAMASAGGAGAGGGGIAFAMGGTDGPNRIVLFAGAVLGLLVLAFAIAGGVILASSSGNDDDGVSAVEATGTAAASTPAAPGVVVETPTIDLSASATPTEEPETETPTVEPETPTVEAPPDTPVPADTATKVPATQVPATVPPQSTRSPFITLPTAAPTP